MKHNLILIILAIDVNTSVLDTIIKIILIYLLLFLRGLRPRISLIYDPEKLENLGGAAWHFFQLGLQSEF